MVLKMTYKKLLKCSLGLLLPLLLGGCIGLVPSPFRPSPGPTVGPQTNDLAEAFDVVCRNYRLGPDDVLQLHLDEKDWNKPAGGPYKLKVGDRLQVAFILEPDLNQANVIVRPDGMITLPGIGDVRAAGNVPQALAKAIEEKYIKAGIFRRPTHGKREYQLVTVSVLDVARPVDRVIRAAQATTLGPALAAGPGVPQALSTRPLTRQIFVTVKPDGTIDLPMVKDRVLAAGYTVSEVERTVTRLYQEGEGAGVQASLTLYTAASRFCYVLGEVQNPGAYAIRQPITALHAIALAGGHNSRTADLTSVILISKNIYGKPIGRRLDLKRILDVGDMSPAMLVKPYDVIYVPKTYVADLRVFMDQYFSSIAEVVDFIRRN